jgi:hypothetical protein
VLWKMVVSMLCTRAEVVVLCLLVSLYWNPTTNGRKSWIPKFSHEFIWQLMWTAWRKDMVAFMCPQSFCCVGCGMCTITGGYWRWCIRYGGESNENLKSAIKIQNTARLSCKLTTRRRSSSVKMAAPLATCTKEEQRSVICFFK